MRLCREGPLSARGKRRRGKGRRGKGARRQGGKRRRRRGRGSGGRSGGDLFLFLSFPPPLAPRRRRGPGPLLAPRRSPARRCEAAGGRNPGLPRLGGGRRNGAALPAPRPRPSLRSLRSSPALLLPALPPRPSRAGRTFSCDGRRLWRRGRRRSRRRSEEEDLDGSRLGADDGDDGGGGGGGGSSLRGARRGGAKARARAA